MRRILSFVDDTRGIELVLPVTPPAYEWSYGSAVETIALDQLGEVNLRGGRKLAQKTLEILLPAQLYPFCNPGAIPDPWFYWQQLRRWTDSETPVRYLVSGTPINVSVLLEEVSYSEKDGTNDLYVQIALREFQRPDVPVLPVTAKAAETPRPAQTGASNTKSYTIQKGDTLWGIAKKFYGDGKYYTRLASANSIKNPNLIYSGNTLTILPLDNLPGPVKDTPSVVLAKNTTYDTVTKTWR